MLTCILRCVWVVWSTGSWIGSTSADTQHVGKPAAISPLECRAQNKAEGERIKAEAQKQAAEDAAREEARQQSARRANAEMAAANAVLQVQRSIAMHDALSCSASEYNPVIMCEFGAGQPSGMQLTSCTPLAKRLCIIVNM